jgi:hypothetical protein
MKIVLSICLALICFSNLALAKSIGADCGLYKEKIKYDLLKSTSTDKYSSVQDELETMKQICFEVAAEYKLDIIAKKFECSNIGDLEQSTICYLDIADYITLSVPWF